jgi:hypothetical protein
VLIRGPIAVVWGEYEFWTDGQFSHCGVDSVDFVKIDGTWKVANFYVDSRKRALSDRSVGLILYVSEASPRSR